MASEMKSSTVLLNDLIFEIEASLAGTVARPGMQGKERRKPDGKKPALSHVPTVEKAPVTINSLDLRVGLITKCEQYTEKLYTEEIEVRVYKCLNSLHIAIFKSTPHLLNQWYSVQKCGEEGNLLITP